VCGYDETGFAGRADTIYLRQAWNFVLSGGALFNHLDYSFTVGHEDGSDAANQAPGGGSATLRGQLKVLSDFIHGFELAELNPDLAVVARASGVVVRALSQPGKAHALYLQGRGPTTLQLRLAPGHWTVEWIDVEDGRVLRRDIAIAKPGEPTSVSSPDFKDAVAVRVTLR
jgi:hypothetical protein